MHQLEQDLMTKMRDDVYRLLERHVNISTAVGISPSHVLHALVLTAVKISFEVDEATTERMLDTIRKHHRERNRSGKTAERP